MANWNVSRDGDKLIEVLERVLAELQILNNRLHTLGSTSEITAKVMNEFKREVKNERP